MPGPEPVVERFLHAVNDKDVKAILTCIDPRQERLFRASFKLVERFSGGLLPVEDLLEMVPGLYQMFQDKLAADIKFSKLQVYRAKLSGQDAEVPAILETVSSNAPGARVRLVFALHQFDEGWRITRIPTTGEAR